MKLILLLILFFVLPAQADVAVLSAGQTYLWTAPPHAPVSVSNGAIVHVSDLGSRLKVVGRKQGTATISAGEARLEVFVVPEAEHELYERLALALKGRRGLELKITPEAKGGPQIAVRGRLLRWDDWLDLAAAAPPGASFSFAATLTPELKRRAENHFKTLLRAAHLPEVALDFEPSAVAEVTTEPADLKAQVERVLGRFGFHVAINSSALSLEPLVRVRLLVAEVRKDSGSTIGVQWPSSIPAQVYPGVQVPTSPIMVDINALERSGLGHVLASPTLLCRSGKEAKFLAGGEIPIKIVNFKIQDIVWKQYGVLLKIHPQADFSGRMSIGIETEVSMLDKASAVDGIPGMLTNRIETHFDLASSRTIVLSGLIKKEWNESTSGLPLLSRLPILGPLFSSRDYQENRTELVVFVTPEIARPDEEVL